MTKPVAPERFAQGLTFEQYRNGMTQNKELYRERYESFRFSEETKARLQSVGQGRDLKVLVLVEDWCGDVLRYVPVVERIAEVMPLWDVKLLYRDENTDLADMWLKRGLHRSIPVIVFFTEDMQELAHFIEKPAAVYTSDAQGREAFAALHADRADSQAYSSEMTPETYALYVEFIQKYRAQNVERWQQLFVEEMIELLEGALETPLSTR